MPDSYTDRTISNSLIDVYNKDDASDFTGLYRIDNSKVYS
jgi:hypothetical protein